MKTGLVPAIGNLLACAALVAGDVVVTIATWASQTFADAVDWLCGSGCKTRRHPGKWHGQRYSVEPVYRAEKDGYVDLDIGAMRKKSPFPIKPEELIAKTKKVLGSEFGTAKGVDASEFLAEDFQFVAPIVGPLDREEFLRAFGSFKLKEAIPDLMNNSYMYVDPLEPNRVWMISRATGTHTGPLNFGGMSIKGEGAHVRMPPIAESMLFDASGRVYTLTVGYCVDKRIGDTEGLGGVLGILKAIGRPLPFPEAQRLYNPSLRFQGFERFSKAIECMGVDPITRQPLNGHAK